ncbi:DUF1168-domain-containing protein [Macroventuria anomochaeta]|uniref:DUF1168-domain-containing protein n=1 Tax=Macroventuria anomochaeta TaxID=301207 RepID=A0ACB6RPA6_9PLEO|nr:DUF1168-domain-containing protein [Macroventuria anomochaeta]KAF2623871.1 DUF1168-domain-containing protein [Macroventuria anomochaeta]
MSEPIPESIPTSADPRSHRPTKRRALTPRAGYASDVEALFAKPDKEIHIPGSAVSKKVSAPPEIVANVQGSSAGAGSGEFHVYKASRRREYERLRAMDEEVQKEVDEKEFLARKAEQEKRDAEKTEKNRAKRAKALARKQKAKLGKKGDAAAAEGDGKAEAGKKKLVPNANGVKTGNGDGAAEAEGGEVKTTDEIGLVIEDDD